MIRKNIRITDAYDVLHLMLRISLSVILRMLLRIFCECYIIRVLLKSEPAKLSCAWEWRHAHGMPVACITQLIHMRGGTHSYVSHDSFICVTRLIHKCGRTLSYFTWRIHMCNTHAQHGCVHVMSDHMDHPYVWAWHMDESCEIWKIPEASMDATHPSWACALSIQGQTRWESKYTKEVMLMAWLWVALHGSSIRVKGLIRVCDMTTSWLIHMFERRLWSHVIYDDQKIKRHVRFFL